MRISTEKTGLDLAKRTSKVIDMLLNDRTYQYSAYMAVDAIERKMRADGVERIITSDIYNRINWNAIKAVWNYLLDTDTIEVLTAHTTRDGTMSFDAVVTRDGVKHSFSTTSILASGEIQQLHLRYIVKTTIKKSGDRAGDAVKYINKGERLRTDVLIARNSYARTEQNHLDALISGDQEAITRYGSGLKSDQKAIDKAIAKLQEFLKK